MMSENELSFQKVKGCFLLGIFFFCACEMFKFNSGIFVSHVALDELFLYKTINVSHTGLRSYWLEIFCFH